MKTKKLMNWMARLALVAGCMVAFFAAQAENITWTNAAGGDFSNPLNWSPNQVPGTADRAVFNIETPEPYTVTWSCPITNDNFFVAKGRLMWNLNGYRYDVIKVNAFSVYSVGFGTTGQTLDIVITNGLLNITSDYYRSIVGDTTVRIAADVSGALGRYDNAGIGAGSRLIIDDAQITSAGRLGVLSGGELVVTNNGYFNNFSNWTAEQAGGSIRVTGDDSFYRTVVGTKNIYGELYIGQGASAQIYGSGQPTTLAGGRVILDNGTVVMVSAATIISELGIVEGDGAVTSTFYNASGWIRPGGTDGAGTIKNVGNFYNYQNENQGTIEVELGGAAAGTYDRLVVSGTLYAGGTLDVSFIDGFKPVYKDSFDILDFTGAANGTFDTVNLPGTSADWDLTELYTDGVIRYIRPAGTVLMVQ